MPITDEKSTHPVFTYDVDALRNKLGQCIQRSLSSDTWSWLTEKASLIAKNDSPQHFMLAFAAVPRKTGKQLVALTDAEVQEIQQIRSGLMIDDWTLDRLCRVWLLLHLNASDEERYVGTIEKLFPTAEMSEQVTLYSALPVLAFPGRWRHRCTEGIRSNIADVLSSIMCNNPYPSENLEEPAWNQLVLKAIFTEKPIDQIIGLDERANKTLASTLSDYAHERWAAHRTVYPLLWRCVGKFIDARIFPDIERIANSPEETERIAAVLSAKDSTYGPALELIGKDPVLSDIANSGVTWRDLAKKLEGNT